MLAYRVMSIHPPDPRTLAALSKIERERLGLLDERLQGSPVGELLSKVDTELREIAWTLAAGAESLCVAPARDAGPGALNTRHSPALRLDAGATAGMLVSFCQHLWRAKWCGGQNARATSNWSRVAAVTSRYTQTASIVRAAI